jgi:hypothetical protein
MDADRTIGLLQLDNVASAQTPSISAIACQQQPVAVDSFAVWSKPRRLISAAPNRNFPR